jgi:subtilisin-like proprotein convertase family protein
VACFFLIALVPATVLAGAGGGPETERPSGGLPLERIGAWTSPAVDVERLLGEDEANRGRMGIPLRIGFAMPVDLTPANSGSWEGLPGGDRLWRLSVRTEGALWVVLGFDRFQLQHGGEMWVSDPDGTTVMGPYGDADIRSHGELWFPPIAGDTLIVELRWPEELAGVEPDIHLGTVSHGYKPFGVVGRALDGPATRALGDSGACNIDVNCPLGNEWQDEKRGVVILLSGGSSFCSGSLINTAANDCRPYVLTARHCGAGPSTSFGFNFEWPLCDGGGTPPSPTNETVTGATELASFSGSDFTLLEMDSAPPESFGTYFNGWTRDTAPGTESCGIHRPSGDAKKICYNADPLIDGQNYGPDHWRVTEWEEGTTEGGSSGSPMFDQDHRIVGQLHGGQASCTNITWDEYGKIDASWSGGGAASTRLSDWLDPEAGGAIFVDGIDHQTCLFQPAGSVTLTANVYACSDTATISLRDDHLRGAPTQDVTLWSDSEAAPETVTLQATTPGNFVGVFDLASVAPASGDGLLSVSHGDTITVEYVDLDDGQGGTNVAVQAAAPVDCQAPAISNVQVSGVTGAEATVSWDTTEPSDSTVTYGEFTPGSSVATEGLVTSHSVKLEGLTECTVYVFSVTSSDEAGNAATDDNQGAFHPFATGVNNQPEYDSTDTPIPIVDNTTFTSAVAVAATDTVLDVEVRLNITHTYDGDLDIFLIGPQGTRVELTSDNGGSGENFIDTIFDDEAGVSITAAGAPFTGRFRPEGSLATLDGISAAGTWTLEVTDDAGADQGELVDWTLILTFEAQQCGPVAALVSHQLEVDACSTGSSGLDNNRWEVGERVEFSLTVENAGTDPVTHASVHVTPLTGGVVMLDDSAIVGDLDPGIAGTTQEPHLIAQLTDTLACGQLMEFQIDLVSDEGSWPASFQQMVGELIPERTGITLSESFAAGIPATWGIVDGSNDAYTWYADDASDPAGCGSPDPGAPIAGRWAAIDSSCTSGGARMDEELISPPLGFVGDPIVTLEFDHWFAWSSQRRDEAADVDVRSSLTGGQWVTVAGWTGASTSNPQHEIIDISAHAADAPDVEIRWHYYNAQSELYWYVDNVVVHFAAPEVCYNEVCAEPSSSPPPIPDGSGASQLMLADRLAPDGSEISIAWDSQCAPVSTNILYGPLDQVSTSTVSGAACGVLNPATWATVPVGDIWFVLVSDDGLGVESSWGQGTDGERNGLVASGMCGSTAKEITGTCP